MDVLQSSSSSRGVEKEKGEEERMEEERNMFKVRIFMVDWRILAAPG